MVAADPVMETPVTGTPGCVRDVELSILFDNHNPSGGPRSLWGFAALIRIGRLRILFDTGSNGPALLANLRALDLDPKDLDLVFLSHQHWDHIGGLDAILAHNPGIRCVAHERFSANLLDDLRGLCGELVVVGQEPLELVPGVYSTGYLASDPPEQALVLDTAAGLALVTGCAHPGIAELVERAAAMGGRSVRWAIGGFHLMRSDHAAIAATLNRLQALGVSDILPTHCTGDAAILACRDRWGAHCHPGGIGQRLVLAP